MRNFVHDVGYAAYTVSAVKSRKMSLDSEMDSLDDRQYTVVDDEVYEPTYAEAFPPLPATPETGDSLQDTAVSGMAVRSSVITQVSSSQNVSYSQCVLLKSFVILV